MSSGLRAKKWWPDQRLEQSGGELARHRARVASSILGLKLVRKRVSLNSSVEEHTGFPMPPACTAGPVLLRIGSTREVK